MTETIAIIDMPSSAGGNRPGLEMAPTALRNAGLVEALHARGVKMVDRANAPKQWRWQKDLVDVEASNGAGVIQHVQHARSRVAAAISDGQRVLGLGGDCTVTIGVVAAYADIGASIGLIYIDGHADLNVPGSVTNGTDEFTPSLDWMGVGHMVGLDGAWEALAAIGPHRPLLAPSDVAIVGWVPEQASEHERRALDDLSLQVIDWSRLSRDPEGEMTQLLASWGTGFDRLLVHFDVDVLDYAQTPIADTSASQGVGLSLDQAQRALACVTQDPRFAALTISEINPANPELDARFDTALSSFVEVIADAVAPSR